MALGCCDTVMLSLNFSSTARVYGAFAFAYATAYVCPADVFLRDAFPPPPFVRPISFPISFGSYSAPDIAFPSLPTLDLLTRKLTLNILTNVSREYNSIYESM